jgi:hypothetical protein
VLAALLAASAAAGCAVPVPDGVPWTIDTTAWTGTAGCTAESCALDGYARRSFDAGQAVAGAITGGTGVLVRCWGPAPRASADPAGTAAVRWFLVETLAGPVWAPDVSLGPEQDRLEELADAVGRCPSNTRGW